MTIKPGAKTIESPKFHQLDKVHKILRIISRVLLMMAFVSFFGGPVVSLVCKEFSKSSIEFPPGDNRGIIVDQEGKIYIGLHFYGRVQVYDKRGSFLYSLAATGKFKMKMVEDGNVKIMDARYKACLIEGNGDIIKELHTENGYPEFEGIDEYRFTDRDNQQYILKTPFFFSPAMVKRLNNGKEYTVVKAPVYLVLIGGPYQALLYCLLVMLYGYYERYKFKK